MGVLKLKGTQQFKRDTADEWLASNPILDEGEPGLELDTGKIKIGDGVKTWANLPYFADVDTLTSSLATVAKSGSYNDLKDKPSSLDGVDGLSAYEIAVKNGFVGDEAGWLESLKGADGKIGVDGAQGQKGDTGDTGVQGIPGEKGDSGKDGLTTSVNGIEQINGNITLTAANIQYDDSENLHQVVSKLLSGEAGTPTGYYSVSVQNPVHGGIISIDKTRAKMNEEITVTIIPESGYALDAKTLKHNNTVIVDNKFIMSDCDTIITGVFDDNNLIYTLSTDGTYYSVKQKSKDLPANQIQAYRDGKPVKIIEPNAFRSNLNIILMDLPDTIEEIGADAFYGCELLTTIRYSKNLKRIGSNAFGYTKAQAHMLPEGLITLGIDSIQSGAREFECYIPSTVKDIPAGVFRSDNVFSKLFIDIEVIPENFFSRNCARILHIGSNTRKILKNAFSALPSAIGAGSVIPQTIKIDEGVEFIGNGAFSVSYNKTWVKQGELIIPASVITIESYAFKDISRKYIVKGRTSIPSTWGANWCYSSESGYPPIIEFQP